MTAKQLAIFLALSLIGLVGYLGYIAAQSPLVIGAFRVALVTVAVSAALSVVGALAFGATWAYFRLQHWMIGVRTADGQTVQFHFAPDGQAYAVDPGNRHNIRVLHMETRSFIPPNTVDEQDQFRTMMWAAFHSRKQKVIDQIVSPESPLELAAPAVPTLVNLQDIFDPAEATIKRLVLGVGAGGQIVTGHLKDLSHVAAAGTSRWGKSTLFQSMLYQLVLAPEPVDFYLSDIGGQAFVSFGLPYADDIASSEKLVADVYELYHERRGRFTRLGREAGQGIRSLDIYNRMTGANLPYSVVAIDEVTALMADSAEMAHQIKDLILQAGKYGIWLLLSGQNWKSKNVDTTIRDQFSTRFQLKAMDRHQAGILIPNSGAEHFTIKGRASVLLPGAAEVQTIQTPYIDEETIAAAIERRPRTVDDLQWMVADEPEADEVTPREQIILDMFDSGASLNQISKAINDGRTGGKYNEEIKWTVKKWRNIDL